jgi:protein-S-isoprenylcysteine O-methyltransferase Ste14
MTPTPRVAFIAVVGTLAYLGLAILGWGSFAAFFSHPALIALAIVLFVMTGVALFSRGNLSPGEREDRGNRWVLAAFGVIGLLLAYLPAYTDRTDVWTLDGDAIRWLGVALFAAGGALRIWPSCSAAGSAGSSPSSPGIRWSRMGSIASFVTPAIWACSSAPWDGRWRFGRESACC